MLSALACLAAVVPTSADLRTRPVSFTSGGEKIVGTVFLPPGSEGKRLPAVVVTGAWFTVQQQMPTTYARAFAAQGYAALVFDFRGFGLSGGKARNAEDPEAKAEDIVAAAKFLASEPYIDPSRLVGMSMCASTGYMANAIRAGAPLRGMASAALWIQDTGAVETVYGGKDAVAALLKVGDEARAEFERTGTVRDVPAAGPEGSDAIMQQAPYYTDPSRGMIPAWDNRFALMSWGDWLRFDSLAPASSLRVPTLVLHSDQAALPDMARRFFAALPGPRAIYWSTEPHMDFYDKPEPVQRSVGLAVDFFGRHVGHKPSDREAIQETLEQVAAAVDAKAWEGLRPMFADEVEVDYSSLGAAKARVKADDLLAQWREVHARYPFTRHVYFNFAVSLNGDQASARHEGMATLTREGGERWTVGGDYLATLAKEKGRWVVTGIRFQLGWQQGQP